MMRTARLIAALGALIIVAACTSAPRFRAQPHEPEPSAGTAPSSDETASANDAAHDTQRDDSSRAPTTEPSGEDVVKAASNYLGVPYRSGGESKHGVDCSGLACVVYQSVGIKLPRTSSDQSRFGEAVARNDLEPGDLVFFGYGHDVSHVGIYAGHGSFIHASNRSRRVRYDRLDNKYFRKRYVTARRVL